MTRLLTYRPGLLFRYAFSPPRVFEMPLKHSIAYGVSAMIQIAKSSDSDPLSCKEICN